MAARLPHDTPCRKDVSDCVSKRDCHGRVVNSCSSTRTPRQNSGPARCQLHPPRPYLPHFRSSSPTLSCSFPLAAVSSLTFSSSLGLDPPSSEFNMLCEKGVLPRSPRTHTERMHARSVARRARACDYGAMPRREGGWQPVHCAFCAGCAGCRQAQWTQRPPSTRTGATQRQRCWQASGRRALGPGLDARPRGVLEGGGV